MLEQKKGLQVGNGTNIWTQVHVQDLSVLYLLLGEDIAQKGGKATWGKEGYYVSPITVTTYAIQRGEES